jgi:tRNA pseudouridine38-40 synthase
MPRYKLTIEYDGALVGWQIQAADLSVQGATRRFCLQRRKGRVQGAGRTTPGCMRYQVAHRSATEGHRYHPGALNAHLRPHPVAILSAEMVAPDFDARRSALRRHYLYRIANRRPDLALERGRAWRVPRPLNAEAMHAAAQRLVGKHDFTTFRSTECQAKSPLDLRWLATRARRRSASPLSRDRSCTTRCARWSAR